jgi:UDP-N-acetylglucosamine 1-carboxyvinyltransferase
MDRILIRGRNRLSGRVAISGAKNAALTLMPCALLTDEPLTLRNLPRLADVDGFGHLLNQLGASTAVEGTRPDEFGRVMTVRAGRITSTEAPYDIVRKMRASILVLGPILAREGRARACHCLAVARSATGPSTCTSRRWRRWVPSSSSRPAMSRRGRPP